MTGKRKLLWVFSGFFALIVVGLSILTQADFGDKTATLIQAGIADSLGYQLEMEAARGNPLTGFSAEGVVLRDGEKILATARKVQLRLSPSTLPEGRPIISTIGLTGLDATSENLAILARTLRKGGGDPPLEVRSIQAMDATLRTGRGPILLREGRAEIQGGSAGIEFALEYQGRKVRLEGQLEISESDVTLSRAGGDIDGAPFALSGPLMPSPDLRASFERCPVALLPLVFPSLKPEEFDGTVSFDASITRGTSGYILQGEMFLPQATVGGFHFTDTRSKWSFRQHQLLFERIEGAINGSPLQGELGMLFRKGERILWNIRAEGRGLPVEAWKTRFSWLQPFSGNIPALTVEIKGPSDRFEGRVSLKRANLELMGNAFGGLSGDVTLALPGEVGLNLQGFWCSSPIDVKGKVLPGEAPELLVDVTSRAFCLKDVRGLNGWLSTMVPEGDLAGTLHVRGPQDAPRFAWDLSSDRIRVKGELIEELSLQGEARGDRLIISGARGTWKGGTIQAEGRLEGLSEPRDSRLELNGDLNALTLASLGGTPDLGGNASGTWSLSGSPEGTALKADISVKKPVWGALTADDMKLSGELKGKKLLLEHVEARGFMKGTLKGKGTLTFDEARKTAFDLSGNLEGLDLKLLVPGLAKSGPDIAGTLKGAFRMRGDSQSPRIEVDAATEGLSVFDLSFNEASGRILWSPDGSSLKDWRSSLWGGGITLAGDFGRGGDKAPLNLKGTFEDLDLLLASQTYEMPLKLSGKASGTFGLSGPSGDPVLDLEARAPQFFLGGFGTTDARIVARGPLSGIEVQGFEALVGKSKLHGEGLLSLATPWEFRFSLGGEELDLALLSRNLARGNRLDPEGVGRMKAEGTLNAGGLTGEGQIVAPALKLWGLRFEDLQIPFVLLEGYLTVEDGSGSLYGGTLNTQWTLGLREEQWGGKVAVEGANLSSAVRDAFNPEGQISGAADFDLHLSGTYGKAFLLNGTGALDVRDGQVKGFSSQKVLAETLDFKSLSASFSIDGKTLYILPGSRVSAPPADNLYRYVSLDGSIVPGGPLDLSGYGDVNLQALNAFLGGLQGIFDAGDGSQDLVQRFIGGLLGGVTKTRNFREVEFGIEGDWDKPLLTKLRTVGENGSVTPSPIPASPSDPDENTGSDRISLKIEIPAGEGGSGEANGMGEQIKQQILEQILRQVLGPEDDQDGTGSSFSD